MNSDELRFHKMLQVLADQCHFQLSETMVEVYDKCLAPYGYPRVCEALYEVFKTRKGGDRFPSVADILEQMGETVSDRAVAVECANLIFWTFTHWRMDFTGREDFETMFRTKIGELPWTVVQRMGGYRALYREWNECADIATMRAQVRDAAMSAIELTRAGKMEQPLGVEGRSTPKQIGGKNGKTKS